MSLIYFRKNGVQVSVSLRFWQHSAAAPRSRQNPSFISRLSIPWNQSWLLFLRKVYVWHVRGVHGTITNVPALLSNPRGPLFGGSVLQCVTNTEPEAGITGHCRCQALIWHGLQGEESLAHIPVCFSFLFLQPLWHLIREKWLFLQRYKSKVKSAVKQLSNEKTVTL